MTPEDKILISDYMGWNNINYFHKINTNFDPNDASLCVEKMVQTKSKAHASNEWDDFSYFVSEKQGYEVYDKSYRIDFIPWLFNSSNFFSAMSAWLKERKGK